MRHAPEVKRGRVVVVTGASDGMGAAVARALKARGDHVVVSGRSATKTRSMANELRTPGHCADFASIDNVRRLAAELRDQHEGMTSS